MSATRVIAPALNRKPRESVVVVLHHDGWVEVYGERNTETLDNTAARSKQEVTTWVA